MSASASGCSVECGSEGLRAHPRRAPLLAGVVAAATLAPSGGALASPPACMRGDAEMVVHSDLVVRAEVVTARRSRRGTHVEIEARYRLSEVLKGILRPGQRVRVVASCIDEPVPRELQGYPIVEGYCRGAAGPTVTGVDSASGEAVSSPPGGWLLFLTLNRGDATWSEVGRTGFGGCGLDEAALSTSERRAIERLRQIRESR